MVFMVKPSSCCTLANFFRISVQRQIVSAAALIETRTVFRNKHSSKNQIPNYFFIMSIWLHLFPVWNINREQTLPVSPEFVKNNMFCLASSLHLCCRGCGFFLDVYTSTEYTLACSFKCMFKLNFTGQQTLTTVTMFESS